jgi:flavin reductase (DIM6/NTAB) family NADH-FMN oxidoreductase RutF
MWNHFLEQGKSGFYGVAMMEERDKAAIIEFLNRCVDYSDKSIERKRQRGDDKTLVKEWQTYRDFTAHAIAEIESGELDNWFSISSQSPDLTSESKPKFGSSRKSKDTSKTGGSENLGEYGDLGGYFGHDPTVLDHRQRATLLAAIIAPRPMMLAATSSTAGVQNIAAVSSLSIVSNSPPLISLSLSLNLEGRPRDTLVNLKNNSQITLISLSAEPDSAHLFQVAASSLPPESSEWKKTNTPIEQTSKFGHPLPNLAVSVLECRCVDILDLPEGAVSRLAILRVERILTKAENRTQMAHINIDTIGPASRPRDWSYQLDEY